LNVDAIIEAIVHELATLVAHLATAAGQRAPLAGVGDRLFLDLVAELRAQGVGGKVIADMFGLALRSYQAKVRRLSESRSERGRTLWEAVLDHVRTEVRVRRADVLFRFRYDDEATVRGVLNDLVESELVYRTGRGDGTAYRIAEAGLATDEPDDTLVLLAVNRHGPISTAALAGQVGLDAGALKSALERLAEAGRVQRDDVDGQAVWRCPTVILAPGDGLGAAMLDHVQAMVATLCARLREAPGVGGSTFRFEVWPGHPHADEVHAQLDGLRAGLGDLRARVDGYNATHDAPPDTDRITLYLGQHGGTDEG